MQPWIVFDEQAFCCSYQRQPDRSCGIVKTYFMRANRELVLAHLNGICHRVMKYPRLWHYHHKSRHLTNDDFTIICNNCTGGVILHDLEQRFNTPTVNLSLSVSDFIEFVSDLRGYLLPDVQEERRLNAAYPIGRIEHGDKSHILEFRTL